MEMAEETCKHWAETYLRTEMPHRSLSGLIYPVLGLVRKAKKQLGYLRTNPYETFTDSHIGMKHIEQAKASCPQAMETQAKPRALRCRPLSDYFLQNDITGMARELQCSAGRCAARDVQI
jgi:hypothetical protein